MQRKKMIKEFKKESLYEFLERLQEERNKTAEEEYGDDTEERAAN
jgi:hypothetical protein